MRLSSLPPEGAWWPHGAADSPEPTAWPLHTGFPSPAANDAHRPIRLDDVLAPHPSATFYLRAAGPQRHDGGIVPGDVLVVDRMLAPVDGTLVVASVEGELVTRWLRIGRHRAGLVSAHASSPPVLLGEAEDVAVWGVVTWVLHRIPAPRPPRPSERRRR